MLWNGLDLPHRLHETGLLENHGIQRSKVEKAGDHLRLFHALAVSCAAYQRGAKSFKDKGQDFHGPEAL